MKDKVLDHIQNVRDWLDRAELDYQNEQNWQGELNLNLAQAELKKAWEESQRLHSEEKIVPLPVRKETTELQKSRTRVEKGRRFAALGQHRFGLVAAVVLLIFVSVTPLINNGLLDSYRDQVVEHPDLKERTMTEMMVFNQSTSRTSQPANTAQTQHEQQLQASSSQVRRTAPTNRRAYTQLPLQFNVSKDQLISTPEKGVKVQTVQISEPKIEFANQYSLEGKNIQTLGKNNSFNPVSQKVYSRAIPSEEVQSNKYYDLDVLVDLATEVLYH